MIFINLKKHFENSSQNKGIWYISIQNEPPPMPCFNKTKLSRLIIVMACRLRSGHVPLNKFKHMMRKADSPYCNICDIEEDIQHFVMECARTGCWCISECFSRVYIRHCIQRTLYRLCHKNFDCTK